MPTQGDLSNWALSYPLVLANDIGNRRSWLGTYHLTVIYNRTHHQAIEESLLHDHPIACTNLP